ncbi:MAG: Valine-tRNA ligase [Candidatus Magasanikbacteria bacterium GW2011_GWC2_42_27]|nr:MAG: Valine-tRNA ligase [Candidatus Magasanikbacteria bacterium GW2011_GWC2_42_27]
MLQLEKKLSNKEFVDNAPEAVIAVEKKKLEEATQKLTALQEQLSML